MKTIIEPFKIKVVEPIKFTGIAERKRILKKAYYNPFQIDSQHIIIDLLTDSGTSAMSQNQWAAMMQGDESYAGSKSYFHLKKVIDELTGMPYFFPVHQGRAAERILYGVLAKKKKIFISNTHFDTTRANIEYAGGKAIDIPCDEALDTSSWYPFKGNIHFLTLTLSCRFFKLSIFQSLDFQAFLFFCNPFFKLVVVRIVLIYIKNNFAY